MSTDLSKACRSSFGDRGPGSAPAPIVDNNDAVPSWSKIEQDSPDFALRVRGCFDAGTNKTLATLRRDGAPRISASETEFSSDGEITVGMMSGSTKLLDVRRAVGGQIDAGLALGVEDDTGGIEARLLAGERRQPVGNGIAAHRGGKDGGFRRHRGPGIWVA